jgi:hypothetical protein
MENERNDDWGGRKPRKIKKKNEPKKIHPHEVQFEFLEDDADWSDYGGWE